MEKIIKIQKSLLVKKKVQSKAKQAKQIILRE